MRSAATQTAVREEETDRGSDGRESAARAQGNAGGATLPAHRMRGADRPRAAGAGQREAPRAPVLEAAAVRSVATQTAVREEETDRGSDRNESVPQGHVLDVPTMPAHHMWGADRSRAAGAVPLAVPRAPVLTIDMPENRVMELGSFR